MISLKIPISHHSKEQLMKLDKSLFKIEYHSIINRYLPTYNGTYLRHWGYSPRNGKVEWYVCDIYNMAKKCFTKWGATRVCKKYYKQELQRTLQLQNQIIYYNVEI